MPYLLASWTPVKLFFFFFKRKLRLPAVDEDIFSQVCTFLKHRLV